MINMSGVTMDDGFGGRKPAYMRERDRVTFWRESPPIHARPTMPSISLV